MLIGISYSKADTLTVDLGNGQKTSLYFEEQGKGKPVVILHRGSKGYLEPIFEEVGGYKRIYFDPPGIGNSGSEDWINSADKCLEIFLYGIDSLVNENFIIGGFSYFGYQSRGVLAKRESKVDGMILMCPVIYPDFEKRNRNVLEVQYTDTTFMNTLTEKDEKDKESFSHFVNKSEESYNALKKFDNDNITMNLKFWNRIKNNNYAFSFEPDKLVGSYEKPVLAVVGLQDNVVGYKDALTLFDIYKRMSFSAIDLASHSLPYEQYNVLSALLTDWLLKFKNRNELK